MRNPFRRPTEALAMVAGQQEITASLNSIDGADGAAGGVSVDPVFLYGYDPFAASTLPPPAPRVSRLLAAQVPAVKRCRDLIAGVLGTLPLELWSPANEAVRWALFEQPEPDVPRSVTMTRTFEDLLFEGVAWWKILEFGWHGYPTKVRRLDPSTVSITKQGRVFTTAGGNTGYATEWLSDAEVIRFDSPHDPLLSAGGRAIATLLQLEASAARYANDPVPSTYFTPKDGIDPADDDDVVDFLDSWSAARRKRANGYVPGDFVLNTMSPMTAEQIQLAESRQHAVLEIARLAGVDPEELGVSTTSRTYANMFERRKAYVDFTLGAYRQAFEDRLSMGDITARGYTGRINLDAFMRSDTLTRFQTYQAGVTLFGPGYLAQAARAEGLPAVLNEDGIADPITDENTDTPATQEQA